MATDRVLVTGATGFLGSNLVRRLVARGRDVHALVRPASLLDAAPLAPDVTLHACQGTAGEVHDLVCAVRPRIVYHLAATPRTTDHLDDVDDMVGSTLQLGTQVAYASAISGVAGFVNAGTYWQYRCDPSRQDPVCLYAALKQAFETVLAYCADAYGLRVVTLHLFDTYGPGDRRRKFVDLLIEAARTQRPLAASPGRQRLDLVHVDDVVEAFEAAARWLEGSAPGTHGAFAVRTGQAVDLHELARIVADAMGCDVPVEWGACEYRPRAPMEPPELPVLPGWTPCIALPEGIRTLLAAGQGS